MFSAVLHRPGNLVISFNHFRDFGSNSLDTRIASSVRSAGMWPLDSSSSVSSLCRTLQVGGIHNGNHATRCACASLKSRRISFTRDLPSYLDKLQGTRRCRYASTHASIQNFCIHQNFLFYAPIKSRSLATLRFVGLSNLLDTKKSNDSVMRVISCIYAPALLRSRPMLRKSRK